MKYQNILIENQEGIVILTINRPKALNALNRQTLVEIRHFFTQAYKSIEGLSGVVIKGAGEKAFAAGADITEFTNLDLQAGLTMAQSGQDTFLAIEQFHVPVIAAISGFALGGGCELAMACHMRVASEKARLGQPEVKLGTIPGYGGTQRLVQLVGKTKAIELLLTGDLIKTPQALQWGLVNYAVEHGQELNKSIELLKKISAVAAPIAVQKIIACVNAYFHPTEDGFKREASEFAHCVHTEDFKEGTRAFLTKRTANFQGR